MKETAIVSSVVDQARHQLCRLIVGGCKQGATNIKVRVNLADGQPKAVWVYSHIDDRWHKAESTISDPQIAEAVAGELKRLASAPHTDDWSFRRQEFGDRIEAVIKFHRDTIDSHRGDKFESYLFGVLFYEPKAAKQSRRSSIRRGPQAHVAKY